MSACKLIVSRPKLDLLHMGLFPLQPLRFAASFALARQTTKRQPAFHQSEHPDPEMAIALRECHKGR